MSFRTNVDHTHIDQAKHEIRPQICLERVSFAYPQIHQVEQISEAGRQLAASASSETEGSGTDFDFSHAAVKELTLTIQKGEHIAILGRNGSGKSTLARLIVGLEKAQAGSCFFEGLDSANEEQSWQIRRRCGLIFQNPENQIVASTLEEDVAFGPENLGCPSEEIRQRVDAALSLVGLADRAKDSPAQLSGGQKQKLAIAGVMAMHPEAIIMDEATSMLDPLSRRSVLELLLEQHQQGLTLINITHHMEEALLADRICVMHQGRLVLQGKAAEVFSQPTLIRSLGLDVPAHAAITAAVLQQQLGRELSTELAADEATAARYIAKHFQLREVEPTPAPLLMTQTADEMAPEHSAASSLNKERAAFSAEKIVLKASNLGYRYPSFDGQGAFALSQISFEIYEGECLGLMGASGSGKSTLVQHFNALLEPDEGSLEVCGYQISKLKNKRALRREVQLLFQYPEHQLFADTVEADILYGPRRFGVSEAELKQRLEEVLELCQIDPAWLSQSPFELSGGEKRRVALAGILALKPKLLVLDEPAAGLDPASRDEILSRIQELKDWGVTVVLVSHSMEDLSRFADRIAVLQQGRLLAIDTPSRLFANAELLARAGLEEPAPRRFLRQLQAYFPSLPNEARDADQAAAILDTYLEPLPDLLSQQPRSQSL